MFTKRMQVFLLAVLGVVLACIAKLAWLQVWQHDKYTAEALSSLTSEELVPTPRGRIVAGGGAGGEQVLAEDAPSFDLSVRVRDLQLREVVLKDVRAVLDLRKPWAEYRRAVRDIREAGGDVSEANPAIAELLAKCQAGEEEYRRQHQDQTRRMAEREPLVAELSAATGAPREGLARGLMRALEHVAKNYDGAPPPVAVNLDRSAWDRLYLRQRGALLAGDRAPIPGVLLTHSVFRRYPLGTTACHVLGYVAPLNGDFYEGLAAGSEELEPAERQQLSQRMERRWGLRPEREGLVFHTPFAVGTEPWFFFRTSDGERSWLRPRPGRKYGRALADERVGGYGVEWSYNQTLRGEHAYRISVRTVEPVGWRSAATGREDRDTPLHPGQDVRLTLNLVAQQAAEKALAESGRKGAVVVLDPETGEILVLASYPPFDPGVFASRRNEEINRLLTDPDKPLLCRAYQAAYPPGSTFKPYLSTGAMEERRTGAEGRLLTTHTDYTCSHVLYIGNADFECLGNHGTIDFLTAMRKSCNVYFYHVGLSMGGERLGKWGQAFGFGEPTGLDLPGESAGSMYSPAWKRKKFQGQRGMTAWTDGDSCITAIGQGATTLSPLQNAVGMAAIANGGRLVRPHLVTRPGEEYLRRKVNISPATQQALHKALLGVVNESGTARLAQMSNVLVAGKTGSAEHPPKGSPTHAWFIGFAPNPDPTVAFAVLLENGGHGGVTAAPVARKVLEAIFNVSEAPTTPSGEEQD